ncbi:hypothetical protein MMC34_003120 [Xylographa carneopallida]|nr:hypothetical protein [Xylographa carneopallida]
MKVNSAAVALLLQVLWSCPVESALKRPIRSLKWTHAQSITKRDIDPSLLYPAYNLSVPVDHFHNDSRYEPHSDGMFNLRYFFDASHYKAGGPVIVLASGEDSAIDRLPYLQKGIVAKLAAATNGLGVILEHRYYGTSFPTPDLSTENLRFLTTAQALADTAYFAENVVFPGLEHHNLTASAVPWVAYGGSYAGAFVAFLRVLYPNVFWGAISSSGVVKAIYDYWEYYEPVRQYGPADCITTTQSVIHVVDNILLNHTSLVGQLQKTFLMPNVTYDNDFASILGAGVGGWQSRNWDPAVNDPSFSEYCGNVSSDAVLYPATVSMNASIHSLLSATGFADQAKTLVPRIMNYIGWLNVTEVAPCAASGQTQDDCFSTHIPEFYKQDDLSQSWRSWPYQYCSQWGFLQTGSGVPKNQLPIISRTQTLEYESLICRDAFNITTPPDTDAVNYIGAYNISYNRLAFIDGQEDPWRPATVHAPEAKPWNRTASTDQPFLLIAGAVHHWDENGLFANQTTKALPPAPVADAQKAEESFVQAWVKEKK